jgi:hypothetical protein
MQMRQGENEDWHDDFFFTFTWATRKHSRGGDVILKSESLPSLAPLSWALLQPFLQTDNI